MLTAATIIPSRKILSICTKAQMHTHNAEMHACPFIADVPMYDMEHGQAECTTFDTQERAAVLPRCFQARRGQLTWWPAETSQHLRVCFYHMATLTTTSFCLIMVSHISMSFALSCSPRGSSRDVLKEGTDAHSNIQCVPHR